MSSPVDPHQIPLFPELFEDYYTPPLTSQPEFAQQLENFIKIADYGALLELNFRGLEKSYSLKRSELKIPVQFLKPDSEETSPNFYLFPLEVRHQLEHFRYRLKSFFDHNNSIKTASGYFLFRNYFHRWERFLAECQEELHAYLAEDIGAAQYRHYFEKVLQDGLTWLTRQLSPLAPYQKDFPDWQVILQKRHLFSSTGTTLANLIGTEPQYLLDAIVLKTMHIPHDLKHYTKGVAVLATYKNIHLDYLKDVKIENIRDLKHILEQIDKPKS